MASHTCHADNCRAECPPQYLCCRKHWSMVPQPMQLLVYTHYRRGQCDDMNPSVEWWQAAMTAVLWVATKEQQPLDVVKRELRGCLLSVFAAYERRLEVVDAAMARRREERRV